MQGFFPDPVEKRIEYLAERISIRYKLRKDLPIWGEDELKEVGEMLRKAIKAKMSERELAMERYLHVTARLELLIRRRKEAGGTGKL